MADLPFPLLSGETLHAVRGDTVAQLLALYPQASVRAELIIAALRAGADRTVFFHQGNAPFDLYDENTGFNVYDFAAGRYFAVEVKHRQSQPSSDETAWTNKLKLVNAAAKAGYTLLPVIEQVVTDEHGRKTWLLYPGVVPQSRIFVPRGRGPVSAQLERYAGDRLQSKGGAVLLRDVPGDEYAAWAAGERIDDRRLAEYARNLAARQADPRIPEMSTVFIRTDGTRARTVSFRRMKELSDSYRDIGEVNELTEFFRKAEEFDAAEEQAKAAAEQARAAEHRATAAEQVAARLTTLAAELQAAVAANDQPAIARIAAAMAALHTP